MRAGNSINTYQIDFGKTIFCIFIILMLSLPTFAQVSKVGEIARSNKGGSSKIDGTGTAVFLFFEFFDDFIWLFGHGQQRVLQRRDAEPWLVSLEAGMHAAYYSRETATVTIPSIKANWGILSTHARWNRMQDFTGSFRTFDWQIFQLYLVNQPNIGFRLGSGLSHEIDIDHTLPEYTFGLEFHFEERKFNPLFEIRWSQDYDTGQIPRLEFGSRFDYKMFTSGKFNVLLSAGYTYQRYYSEVSFHFLQTGLNIAFY